MTKRIITILLIIIGLNCQAQDLINPKKIRFKNGYEHKPTLKKIKELSLPHHLTKKPKEL